MLTKEDGIVSGRDFNSGLVLRIPSYFLYRVFCRAQVLLTQKSIFVMFTICQSIAFIQHLLLSRFRKYMNGWPINVDI